MGCDFKTSIVDVLYFLFLFCLKLQIVLNSWETVSSGYPETIFFAPSTLIFFPVFHNPHRKWPGRCSPDSSSGKTHCCPLECYPVGNPLIPMLTKGSGSFVCSSKTFPWTIQFCARIPERKKEYIIVKRRRVELFIPLGLWNKISKFIKRTESNLCSP